MLLLLCFPCLSSTTISVEGEGVTGTEKFHVTMTLFKDGTFTDSYVEDVVELPVHSMLYVNVKLVEGDTPYLLLRNCCGTTTPDRDDPLKYCFIENGYLETVGLFFWLEQGLGKMFISIMPGSCVSWFTSFGNNLILPMVAMPFVSGISHLSF